MKRFILALVVALPLLAQQITPPPPAAPRDPKLPQSVEKVLDNGLRVIVIPKHDIPLVAASLRTPDGELLLAAIDSDAIEASIVAPLQLELVEDGCGGTGNEFETRGRLTLTLDGETIMVPDGTDGMLETSTGAYAVELERALTGDYGERSLFFELLVFAVA